MLLLRFRLAHSYILYSSELRAVRAGINDGKYRKDLPALPRKITLNKNSELNLQYIFH